MVALEGKNHEDTALKFPGVAEQFIDGLPDAACQHFGRRYRDLKPTNVLVAPGGRLRPLDFEMARELHEEANPPLGLGSFGVGTRGYMSPQQALLRLGSLWRRGAYGRWTLVTDERQYRTRVL